MTECHGADKARFVYMEFVHPSLADIVREAARDGFFRLRSPGPDFAEIVMLRFAILATAIEFWSRAGRGLVALAVFDLG